MRWATPRRRSLVALAIWMCTACTSSEATESQGPSEAAQNEPERDKPPPLHETGHIGVIVPERSEAVVATVPGQVRRINVALGASVTADAVLVALDNVELTHRLAAATADLERARAQRSVARTRARRAAGDLRSTRAAADWISAQERRHGESDATESNQVVRAATADVAAYVAAQHNLEREIAALQVRSQAAGTVAAVHVRDGQYLETGDAVADLVSDARKVRFALPASTTLRAGDPVTIERAGETGTGMVATTVQRVAPARDRAGMLVVETASIPSDSGGLGEICRVRIGQTTARSVAPVP